MARIDLTEDAVACLEQASKTFGQGHAAVTALAPTNLAIRRGELTVVLGPSGSGKTTLLNLLGGIQTPTDGRVVVDGHDLTRLDARRLTEVRRDTVGFVFQFFNLVPALTARENVALIAELTGHDDVEERTDAVLAEVGLADRADHFPAQLSGGEQQRVAVARALVKHPPLLLCDEPTGALDIETGRAVLDLLARQAREADRTVVMVTHNAAIGRIADRVIRLRSGAVADDRANTQPQPVAEVDW